MFHFSYGIKGDIEQTNTLVCNIIREINTSAQFLIKKIECKYEMIKRV